jgi:ABC-type multidrug transport system fused ATPase/permease subunit
MKHLNFKKILPHLIAVAVFLLVAVIFCKPALDSNVVMQQGDITASDGMKQQSLQYQQQHGTLPLWSSSMFSGMPTYQILISGPWSPIGYVDKILQLWLPKPFNFFFLCCICFYFLCMSLRIRPYIAILGSLAFAYSTYNPIIAVAGHDSKLLALAYAPALIGAIILIFDKKYLTGFILTALFATLHLEQNHQQISYYVFIITGIMVLFFIAKAIKAQQIKHLVTAVSLTALAALIGICVNAVILFPVMDYANYSKRGGQLVMDNKTDASGSNKMLKDKTVGLTKDYAFDWSYGKAETFSLLIPGVMGYGTAEAQRDGETSIFPQLDDNSNVATYLTDKLNVPEAQADNIATNLSTGLYWGDQPFTMGPVYLGASICFLFIFGMFLIDDKHKWWIFTTSLVGIILALGKHLPGINYFLFDHLPFYNKFRTPSMALVIPQILFPLLSVLAIEKLVEGTYVDGWKKFKFSAITIGAVFLVAAMMYYSFDYSKENKARTTAFNTAFATQDNTLGNRIQTLNAQDQYKPLIDNQLYEDFLSQSKGDQQVARGILNALRKDRASLFGKDILRSLLFVLLTIGLIALYLSKKINTTILLIGLPLLTLFDLIPFDMHYLNENNFQNADSYTDTQFPQTDADKMILADTDPNYRVFNLSTGDPFQDSKTSYYHKSIGGYHPAKLGIYDDLITYQLTSKMNPAVLNMLNTKYLIEKTPDGKGTVAVRNPGALGNCWFVKGIKYVSGPVEEMQALDNFNPKDTAVINETYKDDLKDIAATDTTATIKQTAFDNMDIKYQSHSNAANVAVFSEIFYKDWNAYIDGKKVPVAKADYVLRALLIPAGDHMIEFKFEPTVFAISTMISTIAIWLLVALLLFLCYRVYKEVTEA